MLVGFALKLQLGCISHYTRKFPSNTEILKLWLTACGIQEDFKHNLKLCSFHFEKNCFKSGSIIFDNSIEVQLDDQVTSTNIEVSSTEEMTEDICTITSPSIKKK
ncbi:THAP domain-containing protein 1 isoform X2, partial [Aphis craccivora]